MSDLVKVLRESIGRNRLRMRSLTRFLKRVSIRHGVAIPGDCRCEDVIATLERLNAVVTRRASFLRCADGYLPARLR
jgi:hypothetical protein